MQNSGEIRDAIDRYLKENKISARKFAKILGVRPNTVGHWRENNSEQIRKMHWVKLEPLLHDYIKENKRLKNESIDMSAEIRSNSNSPDEPVINVTLSAEELMMLKQFRKITPSIKQLKAIELLEYWRFLPDEKQIQVVDCTRRGETCVNAGGGIDDRGKERFPTPVSPPQGSRAGRSSSTSSSNNVNNSFNSNRDANIHVVKH